MSTNETMSVEETVRKIVAKVLHKPDFDSASTFKELDADSLDIVQILAAVEDTYDIEIMDDDLEEITDLASFISYVEGKVAEKG